MLKNKYLLSITFKKYAGFTNYLRDLFSIRVLWQYAAAIGCGDFEPFYADFYLRRGPCN